MTRQCHQLYAALASASVHAASTASTTTKKGRFTMNPAIITRLIFLLSVLALLGAAGIMALSSSPSGSVEAGRCIGMGCEKRWY